MECVRTLVLNFRRVFKNISVGTKAVVTIMAEEFFGFFWIRYCKSARLKPINLIRSAERGFSISEFHRYNYKKEDPPRYASKRGVAGVVGVTIQVVCAVVNSK